MATGKEEQTKKEKSKSNRATSPTNKHETEKWVGTCRSVVASVLAYEARIREDQGLAQVASIRGG